MNETHSKSTKYTVSELIQYMMIHQMYSKLMEQIVIYSIYGNFIEYMAKSLNIG